ncbi:S-adenosyl-L-methionine-dependentmethyltransferases superfamily protein [Striga asiatica]|uniref:S-adenosyl-L-methionine-dependentmethyltransferases superfamily protein n=1 Tax=Striga asiatica TaxID=4170 RepID=A0A5A7QWI2_STRAF|nr:S-adenosyl-L-methionine-dependentmethyltransferases superfamily protein [Striga asiatica]
MTNQVTGGCYLETREVSGKGRIRTLRSNERLRKPAEQSRCVGAVRRSSTGAAEQYRCVGAVQVCRVRRGATIRAARVSELWETRGAAVAGEERKIAQRERENKLSPERRGEERRGERA